MGDKMGRKTLVILSLLVCVMVSLVSINICMEEEERLDCIVCIIRTEYNDGNYICVVCSNGECTSFDLSNELFWEEKNCNDDNHYIIRKHNCDAINVLIRQSANSEDICIEYKVNKAKNMKKSLEICSRCIDDFLNARCVLRAIVYCSENDLLIGMGNVNTKIIISK